MEFLFLFPLSLVLSTSLPKLQILFLLFFLLQTPRQASISEVSAYQPCLLLLFLTEVLACLGIVSTFLLPSFLVMLFPVLILLFSLLLLWYVIAFLYLQVYFYFRQSFS